MRTRTRTAHVHTSLPHSTHSPLTSQPQETRIRTKLEREKERESESESELGNPHVSCGAIQRIESSWVDLTEWNGLLLNMLLITLLFIQTADQLMLQFNLARYSQVW
jgi:hypothetical protein